jgi:citrate lyase subunit beta/citryl-CoA lyase
MRSKLFVPGSRPELFAKAMASYADAISIDLEDAVPDSQKDTARAATARFLREIAGQPHGKTIIVRTNGLHSAHFVADLAAIVGPGLDIINLPKVESAADIHAAVATLAEYEQLGDVTQATAILANIETPKGLRLAASIACAHARVVGLQLGLADLFEAAGIQRDHVGAVQQVQLTMRLAAAEAGIWACDSACADIRDIEAFQAEAEAAQRLGYIGKSCIHPSQVGPANAIFRPHEAQIRHALKVVAAHQLAATLGQGAFTVDGKMIDAPFVRRAQVLLEQAHVLGLLPE